MAEAIRDGKDTRNAEVVIARPDGTRLTALVNIRALRDENGIVQGAINCFQDNSGHKALQEQLEARERHLRDLLQALPAAIYTTDADGRITFYNQAAVELAGREPAVGDAWCVTWKLYRPDGTPMRHDECPMAVALRENRPIRGAEAIAERPDGSRVPFTPYPTPIRDGEGRLVGAINMLVDITERKEAETRQKVLIDELNHRVKNILATVQSLAVHTARNASDLRDFSKTFEERIMALAKTHELLTRHSWTRAPVETLLHDIVASYSSDRRLEMSGPSLDLNARAALALCMVLNELATNAAKYGALSSPAGSLRVNWEILSGAEPALMLEWCESGGPPVKAPTRRGFGTRLIERCIEGDLQGRLDLRYEASGLKCAISVPLAVLSPADRIL